MKADRITSIVTAHGEVIGVAQDRQPGKTYGKGFMIVFLDAMEQAAERINSACTLKLCRAISTSPISGPSVRCSWPRRSA